MQPQPYPAGVCFLTSSASRLQPALGRVKFSGGDYSLDPTPVRDDTAYDGLNRTTQLLLPAEPGRGEARPVLRPTYNRAGALAQVSLEFGA